MENTNINAIKDLPDERDWKMIVGSETLPEEFIIDDSTDYQDQGAKSKTRNYCSAFGTTHAVNILNKLEGFDQVKLNAETFGDLMVELGRLDPNSGAYLQDGPKTARDEKHIEGWYLCEDIQAVKYSIFTGRPVVIGSNRISWSDYILKLREGATGHLTIIIGYNKEGLIIKNSYGKDKGKDGVHLLRYEDFGLLFPSKYSLEDKKDGVITHKKMILDGINIPFAKVAFLAGIWNGENPKESLNREEGATMVMRGMEMILSGDIDKEKIKEFLKLIN